jgi:RNA polymerase sigma-54 factor
MNHLEITEEITREMMENPLLELETVPNPLEIELPGGPQGPEEPWNVTEQPGNGSDEFKDEIRKEEAIDWESYLEEYSSAPSTALAMGSHEIPEDTPGFESFTASRTSLSDYLISQWRFSALDMADFRRGEFIIGNLNDNGYLASPLDELASVSGSSLKDMEGTLSRVQDLDPPGIAARDLRECMMIQLHHQGFEDSIAWRICESHLRLLEKKDLQSLCKALQCEKEEVTSAMATLKNLNPRPGVAYSTTDPIYVTPDVYVTKVGDDYEITLNEDGMPRLKFSAAYRQMLSNKNSSEETKKYLSDKLKGAKFLINSIHQRQKTIYRVTESIFRFQRDFLDHGVEHLKPLVLKDVAEDLGFHESTISRVTTNKYVDTPRGVFELKYFFINIVFLIITTQFIYIFNFIHIFYQIQNNSIFRVP